jgi:dUTP pyrophosphatase
MGSRAEVLGNKFPGLSNSENSDFSSSATPFFHGVTALQRPITVKIKRLPELDGLPLPSKMTQHAAGFDLCAAVRQPVDLPPGEIRMIPCGFEMALPEGYEAQIRPRSGLAAKFGVTMVNAPGTIDADYRGQVHVVLINLGKSPFTVERGMRIAQMLVAPVPVVELIEVRELDETPRGKGGFGHTGH